MKRGFSQLDSAVRLRVQALTTRAQIHFRSDYPPIRIGYNLRGTKAGLTYPGRFEMRLNPVLLMENTDAFIHQVPAHELAHIIAYHEFGAKIRPHGREWGAIMELFGVEPQRTHAFDVSRASIRRLRRYPYRCACSIHALTAIIHNRIEKHPHRYVCKRCGSPLQAATEG